jgi:hypothetical protein
MQTADQVPVSAAVPCRPVPHLACPTRFTPSEWLKKNVASLWGHDEPHFPQASLPSAKADVRQAFSGMPLNLCDVVSEGKKGNRRRRAERRFVRTDRDLAAGRRFA